MSRTVKRVRGLLKEKWVPRVSAARIGLGLFTLAALTWALAGTLGTAPRQWKEGEVAPATVYAPFPFVVQETDRTVQVERGELVVSRGERLSRAQVTHLKALDQQIQAGSPPARWWGSFLLSFIFAAVGSIYLKRYEPKVWKNFRHLALLVALLIGVLAAGRLLLASVFVSTWIPVACIPMLLGMLFPPRLGIVMGLLSAGLIGLMGPVDLPVVLSLGIGCFVGAYAVQGIRRRIHFFWAGLITGLAQGMTIVGWTLLMQQPWEVGFSLGLAALGGGFVAGGVITFCLLPLCEFLFALMSEVSLLELSDLNHPLLKELSVKAPGTYHHSLIVAGLAEAACQAIGANALLARVGCYFHDIGKMLHPEYFVENQAPKESRHERLAPSMSSLVILNHVKDGVELARQRRLNPAIIDFIPGHHGTGLIYYFYRRALEEVEDETMLKEEGFRYPGPRPQTRETAVALLADSSEAATRTLKEKNPARIQEVVRRIINNKFIDGQLDECDLTLKDLNRIGEAFLRVLAGIYHRRIEYPKTPWEEEEGQEGRRAG